MSIPLPFHTPFLTEKVTLLFTAHKMGGTLIAHLLKNTTFLLNEFNTRERRDKKAGGRSLFFLSIQLTGKNKQIQQQAKVVENTVSRGRAMLSQYFSLNAQYKIDKNQH